jgi:hypothetical protein
MRRLRSEPIGGALLSVVVKPTCTQGKLSMKTIILASALGAACMSTFAQGTLNFANIGPGWQAKIYDTDGVTPLAGTNFSVQLYWADGIVTDTTQLQPLSPPAFFSSVPSEAGLFFGGTRTIPAAPGSTITADLRVWENLYGSSWVDVVYANDVVGAQVGQSILFHVNLADLSGVPTAITNLHPFSVFILQPSLTPLWVRMQDVGVRTNQLGFNIIANYEVAKIVVEASTNPIDPIWSPLATNFYNGLFKLFYFSDPESTNYPTRFYRTRTQL